MKKKLYLALYLPLIAAVIGCAKIVTIENQASDAGGAADQLGDMKVPDYKAEDFKAVARQVVKVIDSEEFERKLKYYAKVHQQNTGEPYEQAWKDLDPVLVTKQMRSRMRGMTIVTYGGPIALAKYWFAGNIAYDGTEDGPIRMNRSGMRKRSVADISNTVAHETAHRVGLEHLHSDIDLVLASCEPPYVIGSIMEQLVTGDSWSYSSYQCKHMNAP